MHKKEKAKRAVAKPHVKKDDLVVVLSGEDKGKKGKVLAVIAEKGQALVEGVSLMKRHTRPNRNIGKGGIVEKEGPVAISNLGLLTPDGKKLTRATFVKQGEEKNRICAKTNEPLGRK